MARLFEHTIPGLPCKSMTLDVEGRLHDVRRCTDPAVLREALDMPSLQKTVRQAIERKLRALEKANG